MRRSIMGGDNFDRDVVTHDTCIIDCLQSRMSPVSMPDLASKKRRRPFHRDRRSMLSEFGRKFRRKNMVRLRWTRWTRWIRASLALNTIMLFSLWSSIVRFCCCWVTCRPQVRINIGESLRPNIWRHRSALPQRLQLQPLDGATILKRTRKIVCTTLKLQFGATSMQHWRLKRLPRFEILRRENLRRRQNHQQLITTCLVVKSSLWHTM